MRFVLLDADHWQRPVVEHGIRAVYIARYGARLSGFPAHLAALLDDGGQPLSAAGLRFAADGLFSACYLDEPVADVLSAVAGQPVRADQVVEFSSLVAMRPGVILPLIGAAINACLERDVEWGLFTATARLRTLLTRTGFRCQPLAQARQERVSSPAAWGTYYLHDPWVMAVRAADVPRRLLDPSAPGKEPARPAPAPRPAGHGWMRPGSAGPGWIGHA